MTNKSPDSPDQSASRPGVGNTDPSRVRRRLIVGAMGALPSVYTLNSGAQTANTSARCLDAQPATAPAKFTTAPDVWLRQEVVTGSGNIRNLGTETVYCVASPAGAPQNTDSYYYSCVDPMSNKAKTGTLWVFADGTPVNSTDLTKIVPMSKTAFLATGNDKFGLVYVNNQGQPTTLAPGVGGTAPATASCLLSLRPV